MATRELPFAICAHFLYRTLNAALGFQPQVTSASRRRHGEPPAQGRHDRHRSLPGPEPERGRRAGCRRRASWRCSRHDIRGALQGVLGGVGQIEAAALGAEAREQVERIAAAARTLAGLVGDAARRERRSGDADARDASSSTRFLRLRAPPLRRRGARARAAASRSRPRASCPPALRLDPVPLARILDNLRRQRAASSAAPATVRLTVGARRRRRRSSSASPTRARACRRRRRSSVAAAAPAPTAGHGPRPARSSRTLADRLGGARHARQPARRRRRGGAALPGRGRRRGRRRRRRRRPRRPRRPARAARRGQSDQPDGRLADAARRSRPR